jgi:transcriptional regulator with XRE-family HTH domain
MTTSRSQSDVIDGLGLIVRQHRSQRGWTLRDLAHATGMNPNYLGLVERGDNNPTINTLFRIADALGADPAELVREVDAYRRSFLKKG